MRSVSTGHHKGGSSDQTDAVRSGSREYRSDRRAPAAMRRLLTNLVDNALRHGRIPDKDQGPVELRTWMQAGKAFLSVLDRSPGIDPSDIERLKQPFTCLDPDRAGSGGSGLGLAIADRIARAHGATVDLLMRPGGGLEARMELAGFSQPDDRRWR